MHSNNQNVAAILCAGTGILPEWVFYWLESRYADSRKVSSGGMQYALSATRIKDFPFPLAPLLEQHQIVAEVERRLSISDEIERTVDASLKQAERLRQSILKRAFEGKLVPQDPNDEPAEKLLERIRQAKHQTSIPTLKRKVEKIKNITVKQPRLIG